MTDIETKPPHSFYFKDNGLYCLKTDKEDIEEIFICSKLEIKAYLRDIESNHWGRLLEFRDSDNIKHMWSMPMSMLKGSGEELRAELLNRGLLLGHGSFVKNKLLEYITCTKPTVFARCVTHVGWHCEGNNRVFVTPNRTFGESEEKILFQSESASTHFKTSGSLDDWNNNISKYCAGNSRLTLSISSAFASMLLDFTDGSSGGIHFFGGSSIGKTTTLQIATSVFSNPSYMSRWRSTVNGLESLAAARNDCLIVLDEFQQIDPKEAGNAVFTMANGTGKVRANQLGSAKPPSAWRILFLSSGEVDLNQHISEGGKKATSGQKVRCIDIDADAGNGYGIFEELHGFGSGHLLSNHLKAACAQYYGTPAIAFLETLVKPENKATISKEIKETSKRFLNENLKPDADGQVKRVCERFALIAYAGELATKYKLTGWPEGEAVKAAKACFVAWIKHRGGIGCDEHNALLKQVKSIFETHDSRFQEYEHTNQQVRDRLGFKQKIEGRYRYYVHSSGFDELHKGHNKKFARNALISEGWLVVNKNGESSQSVYIPSLGTKGRFYVFADLMLEY